MRLIAPPRTIAPTRSKYWNDDKLIDLALRYEAGYRFKQIAPIYEVHTTRVSQIYQRALKRLTEIDRLNVIYLADLDLSGLAIE